MTVVELVVILCIVGVVLYVLNQVVPMDGRVKTIVNAVVIVAVCLWVLEALGLISPTHLGRLR